MKLFILFLCLIPSLVFGEVFSIIQYTDPHDLNGNKQTYYNDWIVHPDQAYLNIKFVVNTGDLQGGAIDGDQTSLIASATAMDILEGEVPFLFLPGNHDYDNIPFNLDVNRQATHYDIAFPEDDYNGVNIPWYLATWGGNYNNSMRNSYRTFTVGTVEYLVMAIEYCPEATAVIPWAEGVLDAQLISNPDTKIILALHHHFATLGRVLATVGEGGCLPALEAMNGQNLYDGFIVNYPNIVLVMSGHNWDSDLNGSVNIQNPVGTQVINQSRINFQQETGADKWGLRVWTFDTESNIIIGKTYQVLLDNYLTDSDNYFYVRTDRISTQTEIQGITLTECELNN